jgi:hypothetical protein
MRERVKEGPQTMRRIKGGTMMAPVHIFFFSIPPMLVL